MAALTLTDVTGLHRIRQEAIACARLVLGPDRREDVALVVSELTTNALEHGRDEGVSVRLGVEGGMLLVEVVAASEGLPVIADVDHRSVSGRGLRIVSELVDALTIATAGRDVEISCRFERV